jgi:flagellum-specific peptidoglycan hydrolase FlgJ
MRQPPINIVNSAKAASLKWGIPVSVQLAQWILESGWGEHSPGNNPFGMKVRAGRDDPVINLKTREVIRGKEIFILQPFRKFDSITDAFMAHAELLATAPVYAPAMKELPDVYAFIDKMGTKYATAPDYAVKLKGLIKSQGLDKL